MSDPDEFDLLAAAFRQLKDFRLRYTVDPKQRKYNEMFAEAHEEAIQKRNLRGLRAAFSDLCGVVETVSWGPEYLREFEAKHGVSLRDIRGQRSPHRRLQQILKRGSIETPAELRLVLDRLDKPSEQDRDKLTRLVEAYYAAHPKP